MKKRWYLALLCICMVFVLMGCQGSRTEEEVNGDSRTEKEADADSQTEEEVDSDSVYLEKIDESAVGGVYNPQASYSCRLLHYDNQIYTSSLVYDSTDKDELPLDDVLEDSLATVSGNHGVYWSEDGSELTEVTSEGTLYSVKGYDGAFRVAIYYENEIGTDTFYYLVVFDHFNDIYVKNGSDVFSDLLQLSEAVRVEGVLYGEETSIDLTGETAVEEFLTALYDGKVLDASEDAYSVYGQSPSYVLSFYDSNGLATELIVYEKGYVAMEYNGNTALIVKVDGEKCEALMDNLSGDGE